MVVELNLCNIKFSRFIPCEVLDPDCHVGGYSRLLGFGRWWIVTDASGEHAVPSSCLGNMLYHLHVWRACCTICMFGELTVPSSCLRSMLCHLHVWGACCTVFMLGNYSSIDTSPYSRRPESSVAFYIIHIPSLKVIILSTNDADKSVVKWRTNWETTWRKDFFSCRYHAVRLTYFPCAW